jgi:hypothetical protein
MLACRYGDKDLLNGMFKILNKYTSNNSRVKCNDHRSTVEYQNIKGNRVLMRQDRNGANPLHHAIIAANSEAVEWLKEKRKELDTAKWHKKDIDDNDRNSLKFKYSGHDEFFNPMDRSEYQGNGIWFDLDDEKEIAPENIWKKRPSVFQSGHVAEQFSTSALSPAFALIYMSQNGGENTEMRTFLNRTIHDDFHLLFVSLLTVNSHIMCQVDNEVSSFDSDAPESLQEYELAVMLWKLCDSNPSERSPLSNPLSPEDDANMRFIRLLEQQPKKGFELAGLMNLCEKSVKDRHRRQEQLERQQEGDLEDDEADKDPEEETKVRQMIAMNMTEFKSNPKDESSWFKVFPQIHSPVLLSHVFSLHLMTSSSMFVLNQNIHFGHLCV